MSLSTFQVHLVLVFFVYGLSFFSMGLAMALESGRSPLLAEARVLRPLAVFGFVHGSHEWLEMVLLLWGWLGLNIPAYTSWVRLGMLVFSFASLIAFGVFVLRPQEGFKPRDVYLGLVLLAVYITFVVISVVNTQHSTLNDWIQHADGLARYLLAVPGALLAALGFGFYSLTQVFVPALDFFPARYVNAAAFLEWTGMPIQVVRALMALLITVGLIRATQFAEDERKRQFLAVQQARMDALERVQQELIEREALRRELLRHTVIAQEEERTRIARELHDETAQILTAFSLNLAALRDQLVEQPKLIDLLNRLQTLSKRMSRGIYRMVHDLRPAQLDDLGLAAALQYLSDEELKNSGLQVNLVVNGPRFRLDPLVETVFFRVAQEALTNVARYAEVDQAEVQLLSNSDQVILRICDQGVGFDVNEDLMPPKGWGLAGMRERADAIGGQLTIQSSPGKGTMVEIAVPMLSMGTSTGGEKL